MIRVECNDTENRKTNEPKSFSFQEADKWTNLQLDFPRQKREKTQIRSERDTVS